MDRQELSRVSESEACGDNHGRNIVGNCIKQALARACAGA